MKIVVIFSSLFNPMQLIPLFHSLCLTTEDISKNDSLQDVCEVLCQWLYDLSSKVGALITGDCRKCILAIFFFHCEILTLQPGKALSYQIKVRFVRGPGKAKWPSWASHSPDWFIAIVYPFQIF